MQKAAHARARARRSGVALALTAATLVAIAVVVALRSRGGGAGRPRRPPAPALSFEAPRSADPRAAEAYREGLRRWRNALAGPDESFRRATELDPDLGEPRLALAVLLSWQDARVARVAYAEASRRLAKADRAQRDMLDAFEPLLGRTPPDRDEHLRRLAGLVERDSSETFARYQHACAVMARGRFDEAAGRLSVALEIDPGFVEARRAFAEALAHAGRFDEARREADACLGASPSSWPCTSLAIDLAGRAGDCSVVEAAARRAVELAPDLPAPHRALARARFALGAPAASVLEGLRRAWDRTPERDEARDRMLLAMAAGDFAEAGRHASALEVAFGPEASQADRAEGALARAGIGVETGELETARAAAQGLLRGGDPPIPADGADERAVASDLVPRLFETLVRAQAMSSEELGKRRDARARAWLERLEGGWRGHVWLHLHAALAHTPSEALAALGAQRDVAALPSFRRVGLSDADDGRVRFLAGRIDDALPLLRRAAGSCRGLELPMEHVRAHLWLGKSLEARDDRKGACAAYGLVVRRWGEAKPTSTTARAASSRMKAIGCLE
jgi:serine/threonine-protein kinase